MKLAMGPFLWRLAQVVAASSKAKKKYRRLTHSPHMVFLDLAWSASSCAKRDDDRSFETSMLLLAVWDFLFLLFSAR